MNLHKIRVISEAKFGDDPLQAKFGSDLSEPAVTGESKVYFSQNASVQIFEKVLFWRKSGCVFSKFR